jgi:hypothetical protein
MMHAFPRQWRAAARVAPALGLLLFSGAALAREPQIGRDSDQPGPNNFSDYTERASTSPSNVVGTVPVTSPESISPGLSSRQFSLDASKMGQVSGPVVKQSGLTLYVRDVSGPVVPLDLSALRIHKQPVKGQEVVATYQVNQTDNVALSLAGETSRSVAASAGSGTGIMAR